jgi:1-acyl-sn-glycerol-3-phosphate acyltransferase
VLTLPSEPLPSLDELRDAFAALAEKARAPVRPNDLEARDTVFIRRVLPLLGVLYDHYFRCETELAEELPDGPFLAVANHNAMTGIPDMFCHMVAFWRRVTPERRAYGLMHDVPFKFPAAGAWLNAAGALRASPENARRALGEGAAVLVFPGGDIDACRPFRRRYSIELAGRRGFVRTAIRERVPIVPIVSVGGHSSVYIWSDGRRIAELLRLPEIARSNVAPIGFALPWGVIVGVPYPHVPPPVKIHTRILAPIHLDLPPEAADDPAAVERAFERVAGPMRATMDDLRREGTHGLFPRRRRRP